MKVTKFKKIGENVNTKALRFSEGKKIKFAISFDIITNGKRWIDDNKKVHCFKYLKKVDPKFTAKALVLCKFKISLIKFNTIEGA